MFYILNTNIMVTLLQITQNEDGILNSYSEVTEPLSEATKLEVFHLLQKFDPALRRRSSPYDGPHPELAQKLLSWRRERSRALGLSPYVILTQKTLYAIADTVPQTTGELLNIPGFGPVLYEKYGVDILRITCK